MKIRHFCFNFFQVLFFLMKTSIIKNDNYFRSFICKIFGLITNFYPFIN